MTTRTAADAIRDARQGPEGHRAVPLRGVAERAGISAAQINRIEKGLVDRPSAETLIAIARGLQRNPFFLLVLSGHVSDAEARRRLISMFDEGSEIQQEWESEAPEIRTRLADPEWPEDAVRDIAYTLFIGEELWEVAWDDSFLLMAADSANEQMREIAGLLAAITDERRAKVIDYLRDQVELSRRDLIREYAKDAEEVARMIASGELPEFPVDDDDDADRAAGDVNR